MELATLAALAALALIDSTSFGTLGVPVWMLAQPRVRAGAVLTHLAVIAGFYWVLGVALLLGTQSLVGAMGDLEAISESTPFLWAQLALGVGLFALSFRFTRAKGEARRAQRGGEPSRTERWSSRIVGPDATLGTVAAVAMGAGAVEAASMLPYLAAIALLAQAGLGIAAGASVLLGYVVLMVLPALVLLGARLRMHARLTPLLERLNGWLRRSKDEMLGWVLGIVGFLLAADAATRLGLFGG